MSIEIFFDTPGTYTIEDDGIRGNNISVVRDTFGIVVATFVHPADALTFTPNVAGVNFVINIADSLGSADVTFGNLTDPAHRPDSIVVKAMRSDGITTLAANGSITEGGKDAAADIIAAGIALRAEGGIGTATNAIETQTTFVEGFAAAGGINIANIGQLQIGGVTSSLTGLSVSGGDIKLSAVGSIFLNDTDGAAMVQGAISSSNVTLTAIGALSDIYAVADAKVVQTPGGTITFNAGRDILIGPSGTDYDNDLLATGDIRITAGGDVRLDGASNIRTGAFGGVVGGDIIITAGHDINLEDTTGGLETIESFNGDVILTTGPGGTYRQNAVFTAAVQSTNNIFINADNVGLFSGGISTSGLGDVVIRPVTPGLGVVLGTASDPFGAIGLSSAELDRIFSINLTVGSAETGSVEFVNPLMPGNVFNMEVQSGTEIFMNSSLALGGSLTLRAGDDLHFGPAGSFTSSAGGLTAYVDDAQDDGGDGGLGNLNGALTVATTIRLNGNLNNDVMNGSAADDMLMGNAGNDQLQGFTGADLLNGGTGTDLMVGGPGDDIYVVDSAGDILFEAAGEGFDTVQSSVTHTLALDVEKLVLTGTAAINGNGNALDNMIFGNAGANLLDGKAGVDNLRGGDGDDILVVQDAGDTVVELAGGGTDLVRASISFTLSSNVENLTLQGGAAPINGTGNTLANVITGNVGANTLNGLGGADTMIGLAGNDVYVVDNVGDIVTEAAAAGTDRVQSSINYTLGANLEDLTLTGSAVSGAGNGVANTIVGNSAANTLDGADGADILKGSGGNDTLIGGLGNDDLYGGAGNDDLFGNAGLDKYRFDTALNASTNVDDMLDYSVADDSIWLDRLIFTGIAADGGLSAAAVRLGTAALDADDRIIYDSATGNIFYDADGNGASAQILFATVAAGTGLTRLDFFAYTGI